MPQLKNPHVIAAVLVAVAASLAAAAPEFSPKAAPYFHLAAGLLTAVGLVLAGNAGPAPALPDAPKPPSEAGK